MGLAWFNKHIDMNKPTSLVKLIIPMVLILVITIIADLVFENWEHWFGQTNAPLVQANKYYGSGIDWDGSNDYFVSNPADALIYYREFTGPVYTMFLDIKRTSYAKDEYELLISTIDDAGQTITFSHILDYDDPTSKYVKFDQENINEVIINIKAMDESLIDDSSIAFNVVEPLMISWVHVIKTACVMIMGYIGFILYKIQRKEHYGQY